MDKYYVNNPLLCLWKRVALNPDSTTFADVTEKSPLYICKHYCEGFGVYKKQGEVYRCAHYVKQGRIYKER